MAGAEAAPTRAGDAAIQQLLDDSEKKCSDHVDAIALILSDVCKLSREYVDRMTSVRIKSKKRKSKKGSDNNLLPLLKDAETLIAECKTSASGISHKCNVTSCVLVGNKTLVDNLQSVGALGNDINIRAPTDGKWCDVLGLIALADGRLLLADWDNRNIKLFDINHNLVSHVQLLQVDDLYLRNGEPWDIAEIDGGQVAVCLPLIKKIQLVSVSGILTLGRIIETAMDCCSVTRCGDNLAAVDGWSPDIVEIDMTGRKVRTVWKSPGGELTYIIHNTRGEFITTGWGLTIIRVTRDGVVLARYPRGHLGLPRGLAVHPDGSIYVCNEGSDNIARITADRTRCLSKVTEFSPYSICYNQHNNSLYVSLRYEDCMKVFRLGY